MKKQRFTEQQIIGVLREQDAGTKAANLCCKHGISEAKFKTMDCSPFASLMLKRSDAGRLQTSIRRHHFRSAQMGYSRFSGRLLPENRVLAGLTALVDDGRLAGSSDIASLRRMFGDLMTFNDWLSGPGQRSLSQAVGGAAQSLSLRRQRHTCQSSIVNWR